MDARVIRKNFPIDVPIALDSETKTLFSSLVFFEAIRLATLDPERYLLPEETQADKQRIFYRFDSSSPFSVYLSLQAHRVARIMERAKAKRVVQIMPLVAEAVRLAARQMHELGLGAVSASSDRGASLRDVQSDAPSHAVSAKQKPKQEAPKQAIASTEDQKNEAPKSLGIIQKERKNHAVPLGLMK